jgi:hypothetical protein
MYTKYSAPVGVGEHAPEAGEEGVRHRVHDILVRIAQV